MKQKTLLQGIGVISSIVIILSVFLPWFTIALQGFEVEITGTDTTAGIAVLIIGTVSLLFFLIQSINYNMIITIILNILAGGIIWLAMSDPIEYSRDVPELPPLAEYLLEEATEPAIGLYVSLIGIVGCILLSLIIQYTIHNEEES